VVVVRADLALRWMLWVVAYALMSWMGLRLRIPPTDIAAFWPAAGVGLAAVVNLRVVGASWLMSSMVVPVGYLIVALPLRGPSLPTLGYMVANSVEAVLAAVILRHLTRNRTGPVVSLPVVGKFVLTCVTAPLITGAIAGVIHGLFFSWPDAFAAGVTWWLSDSVGMLALGPVLLSLSAVAQVWTRFHRQRWEAVAATLAMFVAATWLFLAPEAAHVFPGIFASLWWALRFGLGPTSLWMGFFATATAVASANNTGPFAGSFTLVLTKVFVVAYVVAILAVAAAAEGRRRAMRELRTYARDLEMATTHDLLTGMPVLGEMLNRVREMPEDEQIALAVMDLDNLSIINDTLGRAAGDQVVYAVAQRFTAAKREQDHIARLGGDEFALLIRDVDSELTAERVVSHFSDAMLLPFDIGQQSVSLSVSVGMTIGCASEFEPLLREADHALHAAKGAGRNRLVIRTEEQRRAEAEQQYLVDGLEPAIESGQLFCDYQPIFHTNDGSTPGAEALIRWNHPDRGLLSPAIFLPPQERAGRMPVIGEFVLKVALAQLVTWMSSADPETPQWVSVNVSPAELLDGQLHNRVLAAIEEANADPSRLVLELTEESMVHMTSQTRFQLEKLREAGVRIAIDDFGTGYSSLAYLSRLPIDVLKLDAAFVGSSGVERDTRLLRAVCALANDIGLTTIIEGVESAQQLSDAVAAGADAVQGYLLGRPGPAIDLRTHQVNMAQYQPATVPLAPARTWGST
jgi:diguanylate cyclase (GGDEF)-like protein